MAKKTKGKRITIRVVLSGVLLCALAISVGIYSQYKQKNAKPPDMQQLSKSIGIPVTQQLIPTGNKGRPGIVRGVRWVVIHETANHSIGANAAAHSTYLLKHSVSNSLSWHYTVDDHEIYHHLPDNEVGWHAGDKLHFGGGNKNGIGIEICVNDDGDFEQSLENAARLTAYLLDYYDLPTKNIKQHADFMQKNCPMTLRDSGRWEEFVQMVDQFRS